MKRLALVCVALIAAACSSNPSKPPPAPSVSVWQLAWQPPTEAEDGAAVDDLTGYRVEWGTSGTFDQRAEVPVGQLTYRVTIARQSSSAFRVVALSASRGESDASNVVVTPVR